MAKKLEKIVEEVKEIEVELASKLHSAFHTVCTKFGNILFTDGKAKISSDNQELVNELQNINAIKPLEQPPEQTNGETTGQKTDKTNG